LAGHSIYGFDSLMDALTEELNKRRDQIYRSQEVKAEDARFIFLTSNPFFGILSFPAEKRTSDFMFALEGYAKAIKKSENIENESFLVVCSDKARLEKFNRSYFQDPDGTDKEDFEESVEESEKLLYEINRILGPASCQRYGTSMEHMQFAIFGSLVFEFVMKLGKDKHKGHSEIEYTRRIDDQYVARTYAQFAKAFINQKTP